MSLADNGYVQFLRFLEYKLIERGKQFIKIDKWFPSSKKCSSCGVVKSEMPLSDRICRCLAWSYVQDSDVNAAINIRTAGIPEVAR